MRCRLVQRLQYGHTAGPDLDGTWAEPGTIIEHRDAWRLVRLGAALPADEDCQRKAGMGSRELAEATMAAERISKGIAPEDYEAYDAGLMDGYNPDGSWRPGPAGIGMEDLEDE